MICLNILKIIFAPKAENREAKITNATEGKCASYDQFT